MPPVGDDLSVLQKEEWQRLAGVALGEATELHEALGHILRGYRYLELIHDRHVPTARRYKEVLAKLIGKMDPAFDGGVIAYDEEMAALDLEMGDLLDLAHVDLECFYIFSRTVLDRVAQYVELYFGAEPGLPVGTHDGLLERFNEYVVRRGIVVPPDLRGALAHAHESLYVHRADSTTNNSRHAQSPGDLMVAHTETGPTPTTLLLLTTGQLLAVVDAYLQTVVELIKSNPNRAQLFRRARRESEV